MASHNMAADLSYTYIGGNQYRFTLTVYRDCSGIPASTNWWLYISSPTCGVNTSIMLSQVAGPAGPSGTNVSQLCGTATSTCNGGTNPGVQVYYYEGVYTITCQAADWRFYAEECCRNPATNLNGADSYDLYVQATLNNTGPGGAAANANNSPSFTNLPVPYVCAGQPVSYSNNSVEPDGDVLVYTLIQPLHDAAGTVPYNAGFSATNPLNTSTGFTFNTTTGQMTFTPTAGQNQVAVVSMRVDEYRNGVLIGSTMRDIQFIVRTGCTNNSPASGGVASVVGATVNSPFAISACSGNNVSFNFPVSDPDGNNITVSALGLASLPGTPNFVVTNNNTQTQGCRLTGLYPARQTACTRLVSEFRITVARSLG